MAEGNRDEADKCKQVAMTALSAGNKDKAIRMLEKAKRMCPSDGSIDQLLAQAQSYEPSTAPAEDEGMRHRTSSSNSSYPSYPESGAGSRESSGRTSGTRRNKAGQEYTGEQAQEVQRVLRTKDYYQILGIAKDADENAVKKAYRKLAVKLHPDKNHAPGSEEAFKKLAKVCQCLQEADKRQVYDQYGDEDAIPQHRRQHYQQDFMTPEDLFNAFFGGGHVFHGGGHRQHNHEEGGEGGAQRAHLFQMLPVLLLVFLTLASNFASNNSAGRFSFTQTPQYQNERQTDTIGVSFFVTNDFEQHYQPHTKAMADFERQVEMYYIRQLHSECDYQEKVMYKKVMYAKRRGGNKEELDKARSHPRPACKEIDKIKKRHQSIYRSAMYMGGF
jgi:curved DNA-binding protein CbpA